MKPDWLITGINTTGIPPKDVWKHSLHYTLQDHQMNLTPAGVSQVSDYGFTMVVHVKIYIYLEAQINEEYFFSQK